MKLILDTHALVWAVEDRSRLGKAARKVQRVLAVMYLGGRAMSAVVLPVSRVTPVLVRDRSRVLKFFPLPPAQV